MFSGKLGEDFSLIVSVQPDESVLPFPMRQSSGLRHRKHRFTVKVMRNIRFEWDISVIADGH